MNENYKALVNEYCELTGRPVATLTVEEFLSFKASCINPSYTVPSENNNMQNTPIVNKETVKEINKQTERMEVKNANNAENTPVNNQNILALIKSIPS